jgi:2-polyprenyl-3-methyl-5-hydroxy-6-metoxy-1,4-benzoquinol methylase
VEVLPVDLSAHAAAHVERYDTIVCNLVLCSVPNLKEAVRDLRTLLKPGGRLLFIEHVAAGDSSSWRAFVQRAVEPLWFVCGDGCHLTHATGNIILQSGPWASMDVQYFEQSLPAAPLRFLVGRHVFGTVVK